VGGEAIQTAKLKLDLCTVGEDVKWCGDHCGKTVWQVCQEIELPQSQAIPFLDMDVRKCK
jgi:hypothetical protein